MKYCVLVQTELAKREFGYFETPCFFETLEEAKAYADQQHAIISDYPANVDVSIFVALED